MRNAFALLLSALLSLSAAVAQDPAQAPAPEPTPTDVTDLGLSSVLTVNIKVDLLSVLAIARNKQGDYMSGLSASDFVVYEDGEERPILEFGQDTVPANVLFLLDASWSVTDRLREICAAAVDLARHLRPEDRFSVMVFATETRLILNWTNDVQALVNALSSVSTFGRTAIYDSIDYAVRRQFSNVVGKKAIILLTDGVDNSSRISLSDAIRRARRAEVTVYPIIHSVPFLQRYRESLAQRHFFNPRISASLIKILEAQNEFVDLSLRAGGKVIFSDGFLDLHAIYGRIVEELKNQYKITFAPSRDDETKRIEVKLRRGDGTVYVRLGYFK